VGATITGVEALDIRFPTSRALDGSDAMNFRDNAFTPCRSAGESSRQVRRCRTA
jgi:hypothetical protein